MVYPVLLEMVLTMKWCEMVSILIGLLIILSFSIIRINFSNDLFLLCVLNIIDGFNCTFIQYLEHLLILIPFEIDASVATSNIIH